VWITIAQHMASSLHAFWKRMHSGKALIKEKKSVLSATSPSIGNYAKK